MPLPGTTERQNLQPGRLLILQIIVPGEEKFSVRGQIVWTNKGHMQGSGLAGIQFSPFGEGKPYNSFKTRKTLEKLTEQYLNTN